MATGTIRQTVNASGSGYCRMADGTLIQWGSEDVKSGSTTAQGSLYAYAATINFPVSFYDSNNMVTGSSKFGAAAELPFGFVSSTTTTATVRLWDVVSRTATGTTYWVVKWYAVGRWKA